MEKLLSAKMDEIIASKQNAPPQLSPEPVSWQAFEGSQVFEGKTDTQNYLAPGASATIQNPFQSFKGNQVFKGNFTSVNRAG